MDKLESLSAFVAVVETGGFSAASRRLGRPLATVSRKVSELEESLGARLLTRSTRRVALTENGRQLFETARRVLDDLETAERVAAGEFHAPRGELVVTAPIVFGRLHVVPTAIEFLDSFPDVSLRLMLVDRLVDLLEENIDVAVRIANLPDSALVAIRIGTIRTVLCASQSYLSQHGEPLEPDDLARHRVIGTLLGSLPGEWMFRIAGALKAAPLHPRLAVSTAEAAIDAALAGFGIARVLSYQVAQPVREGRLKLLLEKFEPEPAPLSLVHAGGRFVPAKTRAFLDFMVPRLKARLQTLP
jgi:DNA-binding transcriptional LysR family regulator